MLSEKEIVALKAGAYGVTRSGVQVKYIGKTEDGNYGWVMYHKGHIDKIDTTYVEFDRFFHKDESPLDVVGLWEDKPEPFDLERALAGEAFNHNGERCWVIGKSRMTFAYVCQTAKGLLFMLNQSDYGACTMWRELEPATLSVDDLPKPIREFGDLEEVWGIALSYDDNKYIPVCYERESGWSGAECKRVVNGIYYATKDNCQAVCDWLMNR